MRATSCALASHWPVARGRWTPGVLCGLCRAAEASRGSPAPGWPSAAVQRTGDPGAGAILYGRSRRERLSRGAAVGGIDRTNGYRVFGQRNAGRVGHGRNGQSNRQRNTGDELFHVVHLIVCSAETDQPRQRFSVYGTPAGGEPQDARPVGARSWSMAGSNSAVAVISRRFCSGYGKSEYGCIGPGRLDIILRLNQIPRQGVCACGHCSP